MARGYGQICPLAKAAEVLTERWTLLIVRELLFGSRRFNQLRRGIPLIAPAMLSQRLRDLEAAGIVERRSSESAGLTSGEYRLTPAGEELRPIVEQLAVWGHRWAVGDLTREDFDPAYLMWAIHRCLRVDQLPAPSAVLAFELRGVPARERSWWIVVREGHVDLCLHHPGFDIDLTITADVRVLGAIWLGKLSAEDAIRSGELGLGGDRSLLRSFPKWFARSPAALRAATLEPPR